MKALIIDAHRDGYSVDQVYETITVSDLIYRLKDFDEDIPVYISYDNGYTYGGISEYDINLEDVEEEEDYEEEEEEDEEDEDEDFFEESKKSSKRLKRNF